MQHSILQPSVEMSERRERIASSGNEVGQDVYGNTKRIWAFKKIKVDVVVGNWKRNHL